MPDVARGVGASIPRPDAPAKVRGDFEFASDLVAPGMLYGRTLRSQHARAVIRALDTSRAERLPGVRAVFAAADLPTRQRYGVHGELDQPVLVGVGEEVQYAGEPIALVAADHPEEALQALRAIEVEYEEREPLTDPVEALRRGESLRTLVIRSGDPEARADVVVEGYYETGQQDQAALGPEAGLAVPGPHGGEVDLWVATQALHVDLRQVAACLGLPAERVRVHLAGVGGAFGAREDLSVHTHACLLALRTGRPVKMWYGREESFLGHVHRHPARMWYAHGATAEGDLVFVRATIVLDGGAYTSTSTAVTANAATFGAGPYRVPNALVWCAAARTNRVPNGAMRGFGTVQSCFAHESQMDRLAARLGLDPAAIRLRNALRQGDRMITGQVVTGSAPVEKLIRRCAALPLPPPISGPNLALPGGAGNLGEPKHVRRGVGFALGYKNIAYSEGSDDSVIARVRLERRGAEAVAVVKTAAVEVGQGLVTVLQQVTRTELGVDEVELEPADTLIGDAGSSSASRQTWMSGGAVQQAARQVREEVLRRAGPPGQALGGGHVLDEEGQQLAPVALLLDEPVECEVEFHHRPTTPLDEHGQGEPHVSFMFVAQRAAVDVDPEAGVARVVQVATAQDVGRAINPLQVHGQIAGAVSQGVGLATMEELQVQDGLIRNASFTDYLLPTTLDMPAVDSTLIEEPEPDAPYGAKGAGEPPLIASPAAIAAAMRQATGRPLNRIPVRPDELAGLSDTRPERWIEPGTAP